MLFFILQQFRLQIIGFYTIVRKGRRNVRLIRFVSEAIRVKNTGGSMETINEKIDEDVEVRNSLLLNGMITGSAIIHDGAEIMLNGMIVKNVTIEEGAKAMINGMVNGDVQNNGGVLEIFGVVKGNIYKNGGSTTIHPKAVVNGNIIEIK